MMRTFGCCELARPDKAIFCTALNFMSVWFIVSFQQRVYQGVWDGWLYKLDPDLSIQPAEVHLLLIQIHCSYFVFEVVFDFFRRHCWTKRDGIGGQRTCSWGEPCTELVTNASWSVASDHYTYWLLWNCSHNKVRYGVSYTFKFSLFYNILF